MTQNIKAITRRQFTSMAVAVIPAAILGNKVLASSQEMPSGTLWQLPSQTGAQINSYVIRNSGGELIVMDGGRTKDAAYLRKFILEQGNHVHAWFISHTHLDHAEALTEILNNSGDMKIDRIYGSLPDDDWMKVHQSARSFKTQTDFKAALKKSGHELMDLSLGQQIKFKGATIEILGIRNPELTVNAVNNSSVVCRLDTDGHSVLFLGDLGAEGGDKLLASPYRDRLKADYVQMSHHGQTGVSEEFYQIVDPTYCLWPTPAWLWTNKNGKGPWNTLEVRAWMNALSIEKHYIAKDGLHQINL
jgi:beta-lactamase superfamily II metal-dependent hydrolase